MAASPADIAKAIKEAPRLVAVTHVQADGDGVASCLAFAGALREVGKEVVIFPAPVPARYKFLKGYDEFYAPGLEFRAGDVIFAFDSADVSRLPAEVADFLKGGGVVVNVDHHVSNAGFGAINWVEPAAPATAAMVWSVLKECGIPIARDVALALYVGLVTDTGNFTYSNTNAWAFDMAADLTRLGVRPEEVDRLLHRALPLSYVRLLGRVLSSTECTDGVVFMTVTRDALNASGVAPEDVEGLVDYTRKVEGCRVGILFRELDDGGVKVSFRSAGDLDVRPLAVAYGGGGHAAAAGCRVAGTLAEVSATVLSQVLAWLKKHP